MSWSTNTRHLWNLDIGVFTVSKLLRALDDMPHLESLCLYGEAFFAYDDDDTIDTWAPAHAPSLKSFITQ
ncbi:hypothetical protein CVT25_012830 [Psilocybe cyanescens]|uniref:Uncharacterized protein n=1 Tax=Psilocybe cyanescens TaxID=93625 RepID=A0A409XFD3_PSICY|nr:hypothetical protein CVT25_012830 [Psilocybe cyanescens]